jgi:hypothetical protein
MTMPIIRRSFWLKKWILFIYLMPALLLSLAQQSLAQQHSELPASFQRQCKLHLENASLESIIQTLMKTGRISILVDGNPRRESDTLDLQGTLVEVLDRVARDFDYRWKVTKSGVVLMTKRFSAPLERPQLNLPEMQQMAKDMDQVLSTLPGDASGPVSNTRLGAIMKELMSSLTPTQMQALNAGTKLRSVDLDPVQAQLLGQALLTQAFDHERVAVRELIEWLDALPHSSLSAKRFSNLPSEEEPRYDIFLTARDHNGKAIYDSFSRSRITVLKGKRNETQP